MSGQAREPDARHLRRHGVGRGASGSVGFVEGSALSALAAPASL